MVSSPEAPSHLESRYVIILSALFFLGTLQLVCVLALYTIVALITVIYFPVAIISALPLIVWVKLLWFHICRWHQFPTSRPQLTYGIHAAVCLVIASFALAQFNETKAPYLVLSVGVSGVISALGAGLAIYQLRHTTAVPPSSPID